MTDETRTTRDTIRSAIEEWALMWRAGTGRGSVPMLEGPLADLAERLDRAVFGPSEHPAPWRVGTSVPEALYDDSPDGHGGKRGWKVGEMRTPELAARVIDAVNSRAELEAEVRRLPVQIARNWIVGHHDHHGVLVNELPRIAALLREPAARPDGAPTPDEE